MTHPPWTTGRLAPLALLIVLSFPAAALASRAPPMTGRWVLVSGERPIEAAIDRAVAGMDFFTRPLARAAMRERIHPERTVEIRRRGERVVSVLDGSGPYASPSDGSAIQVRGPGGVRSRLSQWWLPGRFVQRFEAAEGTRTNTYTLSPDGHTLRLRVRITSPRLPEAIDYTLSYRAASSPSSARP